MKNEMISRFEKYCKEHKLIEQQDGILIALSGGADSVLLFEMFYAIKEKYGLTLRVFHLNHMLRGSADRDELFVRELCQKNAIECDIFRLEIAHLAKQHHLSEEEAGRNERYRLMHELLNQYGLNKIATAHHADDQAETVLMRIIRGTGLRGLSGIPIRRDEIIRPLLFLKKEEILHYLNDNDIEFMIDETNESNDYFRNRMRNQIIPLLKIENPNILNSIDTLSEIAVQADDYFSKVAEDLISRYSMSPEKIEHQILVEQRPIIVQYVIRKMLSDVGCDKNLSYSHLKIVVDKILETQSTVWDLNLPGCLIERRYNFLAIKTEQLPTESESFCYPIGLHGSYIFAKEQFILRTSEAKKNEKNACNRYIKVIDYDKIKHNLTICNKSEFDFFYPLGLDGKKSLKKYFIDKKVIKEKRIKIPILFDGDQIVCVLGMEIDDRYKITENTKRFFRTEYIPMEEERDQ